MRCPWPLWTLRPFFSENFRFNLAVFHEITKRGRRVSAAILSAGLTFIICGVATGSDLQATRVPEKLRSTAERTNYERTGRYDEALRLCRDFAKAWPSKVRTQRQLG